MRIVRHLVFCWSILGLSLLGLSGCGGSDEAISRPENPDPLPAAGPSTGTSTPGAGPGSTPPPSTEGL